MTHHLEFLDGKVAGQIAKLLRLAFLADERGEIDGAIAAAHRLLATQGRDIHWLSEQLGERLTAPVQTEPLLTPKDRQFVEGIAQQRSPLSDRQMKWLSDVIAKLGRGA